MKAIDFAKMAHKGQVDKAGKDYILHPMFIADQMDTEIEKTVAYLHDVVEDTKYTLDDLRDFGSEVVDAVDHLTRRKNEDYFDYIDRVKENELARKVKLADLKHNADLTRIQNPTQKDKDRQRKYDRAIEILKKPFK